MGIKLTYQQINSDGLNQCMNILMQQKGYASFQAGYNVARIVRQFQKELGIARDAYTKWSTEMIAKDEKGMPKPASPPMSPYTPWEIVDGKAEEFNQKMEEFLKVEVEINSHPIQPADLGNVQLTPQQMLMLEPIFDQAAFEQAYAGPLQTT